MELALLAAHIGHASLDEVAGWSLRQCVSVVQHHEVVLPLINANAQPQEQPVTDPKAATAVAHAFGLVHR